MPTNPEQIHAAVHSIGLGILKQARADASAQREALRLLHKLAQKPEQLATLAESVIRTFEANLRCAVPYREPIDAGYRSNDQQDSLRMLAVDGSQAVPDRHEEVLFALINVGAVVMEPGSGQSPQIEAQTRLFFGDELYGDTGVLLSEGDVALLRDAAERASLLEHTTAASRIRIALTDGPLELWGAKDVSDSGAFERALSKYIEVLRELERRECILAGYVDKPGADLVVRLLEVATSTPADRGRLRSFHPLRGASDRWLFGQILHPGERSAVFLLQSGSRSRYIDSLSLHFFYLNVGSAGHPVVARVEIPRWVADSPAMVEALHAALMQQTAILGARPYPYILHRAHETARITPDEKEQLKRRILLELRNHGVQPGETSSKSSAKHVSEIKGRF